MHEEKNVLYGVIGNPIAHSLSPLIHNFIFNYWGVDGIYLPLLVKMSAKQKIVSSLDTLNFKGANVTVPFKEIIIDQLDVVDAYAQKIGSVNTLVKTPQGWHGYSTDGQGFIEAIKILNIDIPSSRFLILGAGGAARAVSYALANAKAAQILMHNRTISKAEKLIAELSQFCATAIYDPQKSQEFDILVNASSVGLVDKTLPIAKTTIEKAQVVIDLIYSHQSTALLDFAKAANKRIQNGLPMLIFQALAASKIWIGKSTDYQLVHDHLASA